MKRLRLIAAATILFSMTGGAAEPDILIADFEQADYGEWKSEGQAFGPGPAKGTLPGQMAVSGYEGQRLVNSFHQGDGSTGTLTSPPVVIQRRYINFLIGGGGHAGQTCINLLVDGHLVRTATGPNTRPGGSEALDWHAWDVADLVGRQAVIQIVDQATGGWGHINIDHIVQSDRKAATLTLARQLQIDHPYLHLPVKNGAPKRLMRMIVGDRLVRQFEIELAEGEPDFWTYTEVDADAGQAMQIEVERMRADSDALQAIKLADTWPDQQTMYQESLRPQFHFSPARGWTNDPNGLVYYEGEYHLFFQHNPFGTRWGNMTWGHAVSTDLIHWKQLADALHQDQLGTIFSGSAVVDHPNTTGWQSGDHKPIVCIYTSAGGTNAESQGQPFTQSIAWSADRGHSWTKYSQNPVLANIHGGNRDPKVFWHPPTASWVMILYLDRRGDFALFGSPDLKQWTKLSDLPIANGHECPDMFALPVDGDPENTRWVVWEGGGNYLIGGFDGAVFTPESGPHPTKFGANDYAAQSYSDIPPDDGRRIQISWMSGGRYPGMPFNQQMSIPRVLSLRTTPEGIRLFMEPVGEVQRLRGAVHRWRDQPLEPGRNPLADLSGDLWDIVAEIELADARRVEFEIRGHKVEYSLPEGLVALGRAAPLEAADGRLQLRILVDRTSVEVFGGQGRVQIASCFLPDADRKDLALYAADGAARIITLEVYPLRSVWPEPQ